MSDVGIRSFPAYFTALIISNYISLVHNQRSRVLASEGVVNTILKSPNIVD
jgi:hypothetical protein